MADQGFGFATVLAGMGAGVDPDPAEDSDSSGAGPVMIMTEEDIVLEQVSLLEDQVKEASCRGSDLGAGRGRAEMLAARDGESAVAPCRWPTAPAPVPRQATALQSLFAARVPSRAAQRRQ